MCVRVCVCARVGVCTLTSGHSNVKIPFYCYKGRSEVKRSVTSHFTVNSVLKVLTKIIPGRVIYDVVYGVIRITSKFG